jgi:Fe-S-cluster containining protein
MQCCGKLPMTGERSQLTLPTGAVVTACPHLGPSGLCSSYADRPQGCREFFCDAFMTDAKSPGGGR